MRKYLLSAAALVAIAGAAHADDNVTVNGITLYGVVDVGIMYQSHAAPLSDYYPTGLEYTAWGAKNLRSGILTMSPSGLSQSKLGIKGVEEMADGWSGLFKLETGFNPTSGQISNGPQALAQNNGKPALQQQSAGDSSRAGQAFQGAAYAGVTNAKFGTLTFGRQNSPLLDNISKYDPMGGSYAFSPLGYTGTFGGGGDTEDARFDNSAVYVFRYGPARATAMYKFGGNSDATGNAYQFGLGADVERFSIDANYAHTKNAIAAASLGTGTGSTSATAASLAGYSLANTLTGTISDNTTYAAMASYTFGAPKVFVGYEHISFANPSETLGTGAQALGYTLFNPNNAAYNNNKTLNVAWTGLKYSFTPAFDVTGAYYFVKQNNYRGASCVHDTDAGSCAGMYNAASLMTDYRLSKRFDVYAGVLWAQNVGGLSNGITGVSAPAGGGLHNNMISPMTGMRFSF